MSKNFEQSLKSLEELVDALENGDLSLEDSLKKFETGVKLAAKCQKALTNAEQKVSILINDELNSDSWQDLTTDDDYE